MKIKNKFNQNLPVNSLSRATDYFCVIQMKGGKQHGLLL